MEVGMRIAQKKTVANVHGREVQWFRSHYRLLPLEHMLNVMNNDKLPMPLRCAMAAAAAPFLHPKFRATAIDDVGGAEAPGLDLTKFTDEELEQLAHLMAKYKEP
jgi:hypothetical protein